MTIQNSIRPNLSIDTDPQRKKAASPQMLWPGYLRRYTVRNAVLIPAIVLSISFLLSHAWANSRSPPAGTAGARLVFEKSTVSISNEQSSALDRATEEMVAKCGPDWAAKSWVRIEYSVAPTSLPRRDYQLIGTRAERVREYMKRFNPRLTRVLIDISEGPFDDTAGSKLDHSVVVSMMCSL
jgi:hypothetical protein